MDCFDIIFTKMIEIDASAALPGEAIIYACPSLELKLLPGKSAGHGFCAEEFGKLHNEVNNLKGQMSYISGLLGAI